MSKDKPSFSRSSSRGGDKDATKNSYYNRNHGDDLSKSLSELLQSKEYCDFTIIVGNKDFPCHKLMLAKASPYFDRMFTSGMKESRDSKATLKEIEPKTFSAVINFIYTGKVNIDKENFEHLLLAADMLQVDSLSQVCSEYCQQELRWDSSIEIWKLAKRISNKALAKQCLRMAQANFTNIVQSFDKEHFLSLGGDELAELVSSDKLDVAREEQVCDAVLLWFQADSEKRLSDMYKVLRCVRLTELGTHYVRTCLIADEHLMEDKSCIKLINMAQALRSGGHMQPDLVTTLPRPSTRRERLMFVFGAYDKHYPNTPEGEPLYRGEIPVISLQHKKMKSSFHFECPDRYFGLDQNYLAINSLLAFAIGSDIYLLGVDNNENDTELQFLKLNVQRNRWEKLADQQLPAIRQNFSAAVFGEQIYVAGGNNDYQEDIPYIYDEIDVYDTNSRSWNQVGILSKAVHSALCCFYRDCLYVFGGWHYPGDHDESGGIESASDVESGRTNNKQEDNSAHQGESSSQRQDQPAGRSQRSHTRSRSRTPGGRRRRASRKYSRSSSHSGERKSRSSRYRSRSPRNRSSRNNSRCRRSKSYTQRHRPWTSSSYRNWDGRSMSRSSSRSRSRSGSRSSSFYNSSPQNSDYSARFSEDSENDNGELDRDEYGSHDGQDSPYDSYNDDDDENRSNDPDDSDHEADEGKSEERCAFVQKFSLKTYSCDLVTPMPRVQDDGAVIAYNNHAILLAKDFCQVFNFQTETWKLYEHLGVGRDRFGCVQEDGLVYIIGGSRWEDTPDNDNSQRRIDSRSILWMHAKDLIEGRETRWRYFMSLQKDFVTKSAAAVTFYYNNAKDNQNQNH